MSRFTEIIKLVEARSRMLCGLRLASVSLVGGGTLALIIVLLRYTGLLRCTRTCAWGLILLPLFGATLLYIVGWMRQIDLPCTLLRVDLSLETGERLSSLYELYLRGGSNVFRARLEEVVVRQAFSWKRGLPLGRARFSLLGGGAAVLASILLVAFTPPVSLPVPVVASPIAASESAEVRTIAPPSESPSTLPGGSTTQGGEAGLPRESVPDRDLEDLLSELWESPASEGMLNEASGGSAELIRAQKERAKALADLLERIEERLKEEGGGLTPEERRALSELAQQMGNAPLRQALRELLQENDPQALTEGFEKFRSLTESLADQQEASAEETTPGGESAPPGETEEGEAQAAVNWGQPQPEEGEVADGTSNEGAVSPSSSSQSDQEEGLATGDEESFGGEEGATGGESPFATSPGFTPSELAGMIGESGEFREFMTKGVPLEPILTQDGETTRLSVDYDALRALLEERAVPTEAREIIRTYFETITQGGP